MLKIVEEIFEGGGIAKEIGFFTAEGQNIRRAWFDAAGTLIVDTVFEYVTTITMPLAAYPNE
jgi:hypothetical protein